MGIEQIGAIVSIILGVGSVLGFLFAIYSKVKKIDSIEVETKINTQMNKALCEVTEALADHAIATQGADGKVKRSLQTLETLKYQEY